MRFRRLFSWQRSSVLWFLIDFSIGVLSVLIAYRGKALPIDVQTLEPLPWHPGAIPAAIVFGIILGVSYYAFGGGAKEWRRYSWQRNLLGSLTCVAVASVALILIFYLFLLQIGRVVIGLIAVSAFAGTFFGRLLLLSSSELPKRSLILITDETHKPSPQMADMLEGMFHVANLDASKISTAPPEQWIEEWKEVGVNDVVFVGMTDRSVPESLLMDCWKEGIRFVEWNYFVESTFRKLNVYDSHLDWLLHFGQQYAHPSYSKVKRALDIFFAILGIALAWPLMLFGMLLVYCESGRPVFFTQPRIGARGGVFTLWKLRTMVENQGQNASKWSSEGDKRITKVGRFLRKTRIDELPQLFHVLSGEMTLVGPRPEWTEVAKKWQKEIPFYPYRAMVKPGLTGWAQINSSYAETKDEVLEKLSYDFFYIKHASIAFDLRIILRTVSAMFEGGR